MDWVSNVCWFISGVTTGLVATVIFADDGVVRAWVLAIQFVLVLIELIILIRRSLGL